MNPKDFIAAIAPAARADMLQRAGYATDPNYAAKLISIIESYGLSQYDTLSQTIGEVEEDMLSIQDANKIIAFLSAAWQCTEVAEAKAEFNRLANELRKASGQAEE
jgi:Lhr-like helicase